MSDIPDFAITQLDRMKAEEKDMRRKLEHNYLVDYLDSIAKEFGPATVEEWINGWLGENLARHQE